MTTDPALTCLTSHRRDRLMKAINGGVAVNGIDFVVVVETSTPTSAPATRLKMNLVASVELQPPLLPDNIKITDAKGRGVKVLEVVPAAAAGVYEIKTSTAPDGSYAVIEPDQEYILNLVEVEGTPPRPTDRPLNSLDHRHASTTFVYRRNGKTLFDFQQPPPYVQPSRPEPELNYLARDFQSFREVMLDRLSTLIPDWKERHVADAYMTAIELLAHTGDQLAYQQDAVGTECYLETARHRTSVRRHARLVDYRMHEGCNARAFLRIEVGADLTLKPGQLTFCTQPEGDAGVPINNNIIQEADIHDLSTVEQERFWRSVEVFEPVFAPPRSPFYRMDEVIFDKLVESLGLKNAPGAVVVAKTPSRTFLERFVADDKFDAWCRDITDGKVTQFVRDDLLAELNEIIRTEYVAPKDSLPNNVLGRADAACEASERKPQERNRKRLDTDWLSGFVRPANFQQSYQLFERLNNLHFHTWDQEECWLPIGTTSATLDSLHDLVELLPPGSLLLLKEVAGPHTGHEEDADPNHQQVVRIVSVEMIDPGLPENGSSVSEYRTSENAVPTVTAPADSATTATPSVCEAIAGKFGEFFDAGPATAPPPPAIKGPQLYRIHWHKDDALTFPLCLSATFPDCACHGGISVAQGNVILVDHGRTTQDIGETQNDGEDDLLVVTGGVASGCEEWEQELISDRFQATLRETDLTYAEIYTHDANVAAATLTSQQPAKALPAVQLNGLPGRPDGQPSVGAATPASTLLQQLRVAADRFNLFRTMEQQVFDALMKLLPGELSGWLRHVRRNSKTDAAEQQAAIPPLAPSAPREFQASSEDSTVHGLEWYLAKLEDAQPAAPAPVEGKASTEHPECKDSATVLQKRLCDCAATMIVDRMTWQPEFDLLSSGPADRHFVVEMSNSREATLRFGDGHFGRQPTAGTRFLIDYRIGNGTAGNVGAKQITHVIVKETATSPILSVTNPLPATGGIDPESTATVKLVAPFAYQEDQPRAISVSDYQRLALHHFSDQIQNATAVMSPLAGRTRVELAIDPLNAVRDAATLRQQIQATLNRYRSIGHIVDVVAPKTIPIELCVVACVDSDFHSGSIRRDLDDLFSNRILPDGRQGIFHPDRLTFGQNIYASRLLMEAQKIPGIVSVSFSKFGIEPAAASEVTPQVIEIGPLEIAGPGKVTIDLRGGR